MQRGIQRSRGRLMEKGSARKPVESKVFIFNYVTTNYVEERLVNQTERITLRTRQRRREGNVKNKNGKKYSPRAQLYSNYFTGRHR